MVPSPHQWLWIVLDLPLHHSIHGLPPETSPIIGIAHLFVYDCGSDGD